MLCKRPMVVAYKMVPLTYWLVRWLGVAKLPHFSLPNLLAGRTLAPGWYDAFTDIHRQLRCDASASAAREVLDLVRGKR